MDLDKTVDLEEDLMTNVPIDLGNLYKPMPKMIEYHPEVLPPASDQGTTALVVREATSSGGSDTDDSEIAAMKLNLARSEREMFFLGIRPPTGFVTSAMGYARRNPNAILCPIIERLIARALIDAQPGARPSNPEESVDEDEEVDDE